jgi:hypothetical protein
VNDAIIIQHCMSANGWFAPTSGQFYDMARLTYQRHSAYARAHKFDYWSLMGDYVPDMKHGSWAKVLLILKAIYQQYEYIAWIDSDAAIMDFGADLRDAMPKDKYLGCVSHYAPWFDKLQVPKHFNVGVMYVRNSELTTQFFQAWSSAYPGVERWAEQGVFNNMITQPEYTPLFHQVEDKWNATVNVNMVDKPAVKGWHGVMPVAKRLDMMRVEMADDYINYRVL